MQYVKFSGIMTVEIRDSLASVKPSSVITLVKWVCHSAGTCFNPYMARFNNHKQFPFGEYSLGGLISIRSVMGAWRNAVLILQVVAVQHLESVINKRTLSVTSVVVLIETSPWSIVSWAQSSTHSRHSTRVAVFLCLVQVQSSALSMSSWEQVSIGISSYASKFFIDLISVSIPSMTSCSVNFLST